MVNKLSPADQLMSFSKRPHLRQQAHHSSSSSSSSSIDTNGERERERVRVSEKERGGKCVACTAAKQRERIVNGCTTIAVEVATTTTTTMTVAEQNKRLWPMSIAGLKFYILWMYWYAVCMRRCADEYTENSNVRSRCTHSITWHGIVWLLAAAAAVAVCLCL